MQQWSVNNVSEDYLERLTAVGYGEPTFAAFYPNCRSVFGFHDPKFSGNTPIPDGLAYDVIGWYSDPEQNYLSEFIEQFKSRYLKDYEKNPTLQVIRDAITEEFKWKGVTIGSTPESIPQIICHSRIIFQPPANYQGQLPLETANISLAVANTGMEALSAYLAETLDKSQKALLEEQLEALQFSDDLENQALDVGAKFQAIRHNAGFNAVSGGIRWRVRLEAKTTQADDVSTQAKIELPEAITAQLKTVNQRQQTYNQQIEEINSRRKQLFSDWYKYMISTYPPEDSWDDYPDIDAVKYFVQRQGLEPLQSLMSSTGELKVLQDKKGKIMGAAAADPDASSLATELAEAVNQLIDALDAYNQQLANDKTDSEDTTLPPSYCLEATASARYWEPKEPTVLMVGDAVKASERHGQDDLLSEDGLLDCKTIKNKTVEDLIGDTFQTVVNHNDSLAAQPTPPPVGLRIWQKQPWNPMLLEWLVEIFSAENLGNQTTSDRNYDKNFIKTNYTLTENAVDLSPKAAYRVSPSSTGAANQIQSDQESNIYSGFSILTPHANFLLQDRIEDYLAKHESEQAEIINPSYQLISDYIQTRLANEPSDRQIENEIRRQIPPQYPDYGEAIAIDDDPYLAEIGNLQKLKQWYEDEGLDQIPNPINTAKQAQTLLPNLNALSQSLGGFNQALLMHKQTLQLDIDDPIGFEDYQVFTDAVNQAVAGEIRSAPQPLDDFSPIRTGELRIIDLQLVDTFGQVRNLDWRVAGEEYVITPETMKTNENNRVALPPRLAQPLRINFRWLSAIAAAQEEMSELPETNPICGWIIPNNLNSSLIIYSSAGKALGSINTNAEWDYAPGKNDIDPEDIPNQHLRKVVNHILDLGQTFLDPFLICLNNALENIDPESFAQNQSMALLVGRPIAVVRASVDLQVQGLAAINQDWHVFRQEMQRLCPLDQRDTDNFTEVEFPIRIGEYQQFNDGVIGYWKESEAEASDTGYQYEHNIFYAQQSDSSESQYIETQYVDPSNNPDGATESPINILQSINRSPQQLTLLVDPRGVFHATSGILPSKVIDIPAEQYAEALANINVTFLTSPILSDRRQLQLPLPVEPEHQWSWLEQRGSDWTEIPAQPVLQRSTFLTHYPAENAAAAWDDLLVQNWLAVIEDDPDQAAVVAKDQRSPLTGNLTDLDTQIEELFDLYKVNIDPVTTQAVFSETQGIREGWLVLSKS